MICNYSKCDKEAGRLNGNDKRYCSANHYILHKKSKDTEKSSGHGSLSEIDLGIIKDNKKLLSTALKGNQNSIKALKKQGLTYHWTKDSEWGEGRSEL